MPISNFEQPPGIVCIMPNVVFYCAFDGANRFSNLMNVLIKIVYYQEDAQVHIDVSEATTVTPEFAKVRIFF